VSDPEVLETLYREVGGHDWAGDGDVLELAVASGLYASKGEARRAISQGGYSINGMRVGAVDEVLPEALGGRYLVLRAGRKRLVVARRR
jgi:tyrosyl-tRNA synthetase